MDPVQVTIWVLAGIGLLAAAAVIIRDQRYGRVRERQGRQDWQRAPMTVSGGPVSPPAQAAARRPAPPVPPGYPPAHGTDTFAVLAIVFALLGGLVAIPFGHIALHRIKRSGAGGWDMAVIALVIGYLVLGVWLLIGWFVLSAGL